ncbi:nonsense-mediated mRNA decay factor SMG9 [Epargyreus clarus]|uniref:nonsense-mediated mRNA decay factor SMG9 n=1 Tax=Epargyreus clarus TaxID=520877 RepID=UPI003C2B97F1
MAEKKKKVIITKDSVTPRKPVILKSDRESKEQPKVEKEKPTIILKTREQSAPKEDRPQSPKPQTSETGPHPCKIAHNDHKDKKVAEKPSPPLKKFPEAIKLLNENLEFNTAPLQYLNDSNSNYLVVGIMGTQGVGKSMILNLIEQSMNVPDLCEKILHSHETQTSAFDVSTIENQMENLDFSSNSDIKVSKSTDNFVFKMQDMDHIERGVHCTKGIDMYVTNDRVILLDCQALWAPSLIEESNTNPITSRSANIVTVDCLQLASYLISICHVVIAVQDWFTDYNFIRYIQTAEMLKPTLTAPAVLSTSQESSDMPNKGPSHPHLLLLHNRCQLEDFTPDALRTMQDLYRTAFKTSSLQLESGMYMYSDTNKNGLNIDSVCKGYSVENCGAPINFFLLPEIYSDYDNPDIYRGHPPFEQLAKRLRWMILSVNKHQITNIPDLSEKGWFQYCNKAWDTIKKCTFFMEYERFLP